MPNASTLQYLAAAAACADGWPKNRNEGSAASMASEPRRARMKEARTPARSHRATAASSSEPCAWLVSGSRPPTKPIAVTMTSHVAMPPREAAAREASPTWPTIAVSTTPIAINPSSIENTASVCDRDASLEAGAEAEAEADASEREAEDAPGSGEKDPGSPSAAANEAATPRIPRRREPALAGPVRARANAPARRTRRGAHPKTSRRDAGAGRPIGANEPGAGAGDTRARDARG